MTKASALSPSGNLADDIRETLLQESSEHADERPLIAEVHSSSTLSRASLWHPIVMVCLWIPHVIGCVWYTLWQAKSSGFGTKWAFDWGFSCGHFREVGGLNSRCFFHC